LREPKHPEKIVKSAQTASSFFYSLFYLYPLNILDKDVIIKMMHKKGGFF